MIIDNNCPLNMHSTIRLGGTCDGYFPENTKELTSLISKFREEGIEYCIVGRMSNILPTDEKAKAKVIFSDKLNDICYNGLSVTLSCGVRFSQAISRFSNDKKSLCPSLIGIPGMVGGMVCQNASCYDEEIASSFLYAELYSVTDNHIIRLNNEDMQFSYRTSILKTKKFILLNATFKVLDKDVRDIIHFVSEKRRKSMPLKPSLGSVFLRKDGISIGYLLDRLGQKGRRFGGISVSQMHAGVLINENHGTARDYRVAVSTLSELIFKTYGFIPEREVEFLS